MIQKEKKAVISKDAENSLDKIQCQFMLIKITLGKLRIEEYAQTHYTNIVCIIIKL